MFKTDLRSKHKQNTQEHGVRNQKMFEKGAKR